jgi:5'(3')-deoxyribonucleotidase
MRIFLDQDGVLADFIKGVCKVWQVQDEVVFKNWPVGTWDSEEPISKALGLPGIISSTRFWERIRSAQGFWENLEPTPWCKELVELVEEYDKDWMICTAPDKDGHAVPGKIAWMKKQFGERFDRYHITRYKDALAKPNTILIDDKDTHVDCFRLAGGCGILFPRHWNSGHDKQADLIGSVKRGLALHSRATSLMYSQNSKQEVQESVPN